MDVRSVFPSMLNVALCWGGVHESMAAHEKAAGNGLCAQSHGADACMCAPVHRSDVCGDVERQAAAQRGVPESL